jgi:predicted alpha-1,2-mannosidase
MKYKFILLSLLSLFIMSCQQNKSLINKVNPFIGTGGHGHTFPGATVPFGMVQLSPDTRTDSWDGCSGYHYSDSTILGFSHTHLSGTGVGDYGDIRLMPTVGILRLHPGEEGNTRTGYRSHFSHKNETAEPAYYQVYLDDYRVNAELTATTHSGFHQYTFPKSSSSHMILDLTAAVKTEKIIDLQINIEDEHTVSGLRRSSSWAKDQYCYFVIEFNKDFEDYGIQVNGKKHPQLRSSRAKDIQAWFDFNTSSQEKILVKVGLSAVSVESAKINLEREIPKWNFDNTLKESQVKWHQALSQVQVQGSPKDDTIFYTSLYHALIAPNIWSDLDSLYRGHDLKIHEAPHNVYTVFSLWDTFRAEHPLLSILHPDRDKDMIKSMLLMQEQDGLLPVWELAANETNCMIGYHSVPVIYDAYAKGIRDFDTTKALKAMVTSANANHFGLDIYKKYGYIKADKEGESVSKTLEYAYDDWCIAMMAKDMGIDSIYHRFIKRAQNYKNLFDPETGFMRAKINGQWQKPFDPAEVNFHFTEGNSWQYSMFVPQDISGLIKLHGGTHAFEQKLDELFETTSALSGRQQADITGLIGQYAHGNEPSHHMAYLYNFIGKPWKTQKLVAKIMNTLYHAQADGLSGNEDCGQMSAWYVLSSLGFYPVTPGSNEYIFGSPIFKKVRLELPNGNILKIEMKNYQKGHIYIQSIKMNGKEYPNSFFTQQMLMEGGHWEIRMGAKPNKSFGKELNTRPQTSITTDHICPAPSLESDGMSTFIGRTKISMHCPLALSEIYYTTNGNQPDTSSTRYTNPLEITATTHFLFRAYHPIYGYSAVIESQFNKLDDNIDIELIHPYSSMYPAGGKQALIDHIRGSTNFKTGTWQGFHDTDLIAILSFKKKTSIKEISIGFIQDEKSWIFLPRKVEFYTSENKKDWILAGSLTNKLDQHQSPLIHDFSILVYPKKVKYLKIVAENAGSCPDWHLGAGGKTWLFADEISLKP